MWDTIFHAPADLAPLAAFRILFGALVVADAVIYYRDVPELLAPDGFAPHELWTAWAGKRFFSLFLWLPAKRSTVTTMLVVYGMSGAALSIGLMTQLAAVVTFITGVSIYHRNRHVLHSGDTLMRILNFLLIFSSAGASVSVDSALGIASSGSPAAFRLMQLQVAMLYLHAVRFKLKGNVWRHGTATYYASRLLTHRRRQLPAILDGAVAHRFATYGTLVTEFCAGTLLWFSSTRYYALAAAVGLHLALQWLMRMHLFQWIMLASLVLFVPGDDLRALVSFVLGKS